MPAFTASDQFIIYVAIKQGLQVDKTCKTKYPADQQNRSARTFSRPSQTKKRVAAPSHRLGTMRGKVPRVPVADARKRAAAAWQWTLYHLGRVDSAWVRLLWWGRNATVLVAFG